MRSIALLLVCFTACLVGCNDNGGRVPVTGEVNFDGKPLEAGTITFGGAQGAAGVSPIVNGKFTLNQSANQNGVLPGTYEVLVASWVEERGSVREDGSFSPGITRIPLTYLEPQKSGLKAEVKASGKNHFSFELTSDFAKNEKTTIKPVR